ncbi:MAG: hypothetical protein DCC73_12310 [Proteobacteria bacterium]|nr:MAG: hypothetical protein DCC73_12310 [Pseudomonadota bacterium]
MTHLLRLFFSFCRHRLGYRSPAALLLLALSACASSSPPTPLASSSDMAMGSYLAAQHARRSGDTTAAANYFLDAIAADPDNVLLLQQGFSYAVADGRYSDAKRIAERLADTDMNYSLPELFLVLHQIKDGHYGKALDKLQRVPDAGLNRLLKPLVQAWVLVGMKKTDDALMVLEPLRETPAFMPFLLNHRAFLLDYADDPRAAAMYADVAAADRYGSLRAVIGHAGLLTRQGKKDEALAVIAAASKRFPQAASIKLAAARAAAGELGGKVINSPADGIAEAFYSGASALAQESAAGLAAFHLRLALYLKPDFAEARLLLANLFEQEEQHEAALAIYRTVPDDSDVADQARLREVWVLNALNRTEEALQAVEVLLQRGPDEVEVVAALADLLRQENRHDEAIAQYTRAIELSGDAPWSLYYARAIAFDQAKRWGQAEADLKMALQISPEEAEVLNYLGYSWVDRGINLKEAEDMIKRAVLARPDNGYIVDSLGWVLYKLRRYGEAVEHLERAVLLRPEDPTINDHLGDAYWRVNRRIEARFQWSHALSLKPTDEQAAALREKLEHGLNVAAKPRPTKD